MPDFIKGISQISPLSWGSYILANSAFAGETFTCSGDEKDQNGDCPYETGHDVLSLYDMDDGSGPRGTAFHAWILGTVTFAYLLASFIMIRWRAYRLSH